MAEVVDFSLFAGNSIVLEGEVKSGGVGVDLTAGAIRWWIAKQASASPEAVVLMKSSMVDDYDPGGIVITNAAEGLYEITLDPLDTRFIEPGPYYHEVELTDGSGAIWTPTIGTITIRESLISRRRFEGDI